MTHYDELGLSSGASAEQIRQAHKNLARLLHPDQFQDPELKILAESQMKRVNSIYAVLADPARRRLYDRQLVPSGIQAVAGWRSALRRHAGWIAVAAGVAFGVYGLSRPPVEKPVYLERVNAVRPGADQQKRPARAPERGDPSQEDQLRQLARETKELRQTLDQAMIERDQALGRLAALRSTPAITGNIAEPAPPPSIVPATPPAPLPQSRATQRLAGTWIYVPAAKPSPQDLYPAEFIEVIITETETHLWGRYRARYRVPDQALSPAVEFHFEGKPAASGRHLWTGNGGAKGEIQLKLLSGNTLSVDWFTSQLGRSLSLSSGTAVLIRRQE